jgi:magnesium transporter
MIQVVNLGDNSEKILQPQDLKELSVPNVWLEIVDPTEEELTAVSEATQVPINFLRLPRAESYVNFRLEEGYGVINFPVMENVTSTKRAHAVVIAFFKTYLVTVAKKETAGIFSIVKERMNKVKVDPPAQVAYFIIDEIVSHHYGQIEKIESLTAKIEEEVVEKTSQDTLRHIFKLKSNMVRFNKILWYQRGLVFNLKKCEDICMPAKVRGQFDTTHEGLTRQVDIVETYREILSDAINVHLSAISNKINLSIKALTVVIFYLTIVTTVTSFPNTVATFFGISQFGNTNLYIIVVALVLSTILPFAWLWKKGWLTSKKLETL